MVTVDLLRAALSEIQKVACVYTSTEYELHVWASGEFYVAVFPAEHREAVYRYLNFKLRIDVPPGGDALVLTTREAIGLVEHANLDQGQNVRPPAGY